MSDRILFVDDDVLLLAAHERSFRRRFALDVAEGGLAGLSRIATPGQYAVVVADMRMPGMDGIQFLARVREESPSTVRIMLTGNADLDVAIRVVNEGNIFRFLTKPCSPELLGKALEDAVAQYHLVLAEKELLNKTLSGSIKLLTDILSIVDAESFGRAQRLRDLASAAAQQLKWGEAWELHLAVMLASIGYVTVPPETLVKARAGQPLSRIEEQMVERVPEVGARLLANIPRLEPVAQIVRYEHKHYDGTGFPPDSIAGEAIPVGARLIKILSDMMQLQAGGASRQAALAELANRKGWYDPRLLPAVRAAYGLGTGGPDAGRPTISVSARQLAYGMILRSNIETKDGTLILSTGHQINDMTLEKIQNFNRLSGIREPIFVEATEPVPGAGG